MNREHQYEKQRNLQLLTHLNYKEKALRRELKQKRDHVDKKDLFIKKFAVNSQRKNLDLKRNEESKFINNFKQAKNIIEK